MYEIKIIEHTDEPYSKSKGDTIVEVECYNSARIYVRRKIEDYINSNINKFEFSELLIYFDVVLDKLKFKIETDENEIQEMFFVGKYVDYIFTFEINYIDASYQFYRFEREEFF